MHILLSIKRVRDFLVEIVLKRAFYDELLTVTMTLELYKNDYNGRDLCTSLNLDHIYKQILKLTMNRLELVRILMYILGTFFKRLICVFGFFDDL